MSYTRTEFVADQLIAAAPGAEWDAAEVDRAPELARILERNGIIDLSRLRLVKVSVEVTQPGIEPFFEDALALEYEGKYFGFLGSPTEPENRPILHATDKGFEVAWSAEGKGHVGFVVQPTATGFAIVPVWGSSSDADKIRRAVITIAAMFVSFVLPAAGVAAGAAVGSAVVPASFAAAYPGVTAAIGNVAIATAFSGGNIEQAVENVVLGYVTGAGGQWVGSATNVKGIGVVAAAAARAYIKGTDVTDAIRNALISQGASIVDDLFAFQTGDTWNPINTIGPNLFPVPDFSSDDLFTFGLYDDPAYAFDIDGGDPWGFDVDLTPAWMPDPVAIPDVPGWPTSPVGQPSTQPGAESWTYQQILANTSATIQVALQAVAAVKQLQSINVNQQAQVVSGQTVSRATDDGRIATRHPDGSITYSLPPVNTAQATISGNYVINNGDGTYTLVNGAGQRTTRSYTGGTTATTAGGGGFGSLSPTTLAMLAAGALLLMKARR